MSKKFFPKTLSDWLFLIFVLVLGAECHYYSRHRRAERRRARDMRSVERDYPVIRQEGTLRLIAGNDFLSDDQSEIYDAAIQELARDLRQKSGLRVEIVPPDSIDLQFKPLGQLSTGKVDLFVYSSIYDAAIDNREYRHFAEKRAASLYLVQRHADSTRYISQLSAFAGHALTLPKGTPTTYIQKYFVKQTGDSLRIQLDTLHSAEELAKLVVSGKIRYTVCTSREAERFARLYPALDCKLPLTDSVRTLWVTRRNAPTLCDSLAAWGVGQ